MRRCDVPILALFRSPAEQDHQSVSVLAEGDAIARSEVDSVFEKAGPEALHVGEIPPLQPPDGGSDLCGVNCGERGEPSPKRTRTVAVEELQNRQHDNGNICVTIILTRGAPEAICASSEPAYA